MKKVDCLIIGAGLAGLSTAWHLSQRGAENVLVIEQEGKAGVHSSGRNAAMAMQVVSNPLTSAVARKGSAFLRATAKLWHEGIGFRRNGSLLIGTQEQLDGYGETLASCKEEGIPYRLLDREPVIERVPILADLDFDGGIECPLDGWLDIEKLNEGYVREIEERGVTFWSESRAIRILRQSDGSFNVITPRETINTQIIVNAAGAWAAEVAEMASAMPIPLVPNRRHIMQTAPLPFASEEWPIVWDLKHGYYFRPEDGGLLMSPCDQEPAPAGIPEVDEQLIAGFREKMTTLLPMLKGHEVARSWAGLRTMTPDGQFVVGWDPGLRGFYWIAGLGGHGVVVSAALGEMAADQLLEPQTSHHTAYDPSRFQPAGTA